MLDLPVEVDRMGPGTSKALSPITHARYHGEPRCRGQPDDANLFEGSQAVPIVRI